MILLSDPAISAVTVRESGEPLIEMRPNEMFIDDRKKEQNAGCTWIREGLAGKLHQAQRRLPSGVSFLLVEGHRLPELQLQHFEEYWNELAEIHPDWTEVQLRPETARYVSPPEVAPHCTGGAIDLTLCTDTGIELNLGTRINASPIESENRCYTAAVDLPDDALANRRLLIEVLTAVGLVNYPTEWWHWSFGDRYWALMSGNDSPYGPTRVDSAA